MKAQVYDAIRCCAPLSDDDPYEEARLFTYRHKLKLTRPLREPWKAGAHTHTHTRTDKKGREGEGNVSKLTGPRVAEKICGGDMKG